MKLVVLFLLFIIFNVHSQYVKRKIKKIIPYKTDDQVTKGEHFLNALPSKYH